MATKQQLLEKMRQATSEWETPGLWEFVSRNPTIRDWLDNAQKEMNDQQSNSSEDEYELLTSSYLRGVKKAARLHSETVWSKIMIEGGTVVDLDLRFARYIEFCAVYKMYRGREHEKKAPYRIKEVYDDYLLFGLPPKVEPDATVFWGTAQDWWVALRDPAALATIQIFRRLPCNERSRPPELGEVITKMDFTEREDGHAVIKVEKVKRVQRSFY